MKAAHVQNSAHRSGDCGGDFEREGREGLEEGLNAEGAKVPQRTQRKGEGGGQGMDVYVGNEWTSILPKHRVDRAPGIEI